MIYNGNALTGKEIFFNGDSINFDYSGTARRINLPRGKYLFECWGARGGSGGAYVGGSGGYVKGKIELTNEQTFYIYVGQTNDGVAAAWNGGGGSYNDANQYRAGGGASDIRITGKEDATWNDENSLRSRIIVAPGGGGCVYSSYKVNGGHGGGLIGGPGSGNATGGTQTSGGTSSGSGAKNGSFGAGGGDASSSTGGGGGGYYGGAGGPWWTSGAGGSAFISGHSGCDAIKSETDGTHTGQPNHYSGLIFTETEIIAGNNYMPDTISDVEIIGNNKSGFVKITMLNKLSTTNLYFIEFNGKIYYYDKEWVHLERDSAEFTINDIITHGLGNNSPYIEKKYINKLQKLGESGPIKFIMGTHSIEELTRLKIRPETELMHLDQIYNFNIVEKE